MRATLIKNRSDFTSLRNALEDLHSLLARELLITPQKPAIARSHAAAAARMSVEDTTDNVNNSMGSGDASFTVSRLTANEPATVQFADFAGFQSVLNVDANGSYTADLSSLSDRTITSSTTSTTSSLSAANLGAPIPGNSVVLDTDKGLNPSLSFDGTDPAHAVFTISGLNGDEHGTVTFTDVSGHQRRSSRLIQWGVLGKSVKPYGWGGNLSPLGD